MSAYEDSVSKMVDKASWLYGVRCASCKRLLGSSIRRTAHEVLCTECTIECIDALASGADD